MKKYEFSIPMPYAKSQIDEIVDINNKLEKSKITSLYINLPVSCDMHTVFEQQRNIAYDLTDFQYWKELMHYGVTKGFEVIYLINSPRRMEIEYPEKNYKDLRKLHQLLKELNEIGVNKLRVSNPRLLSYLSRHYKNFDLYASTSFEYKTLKEYVNFMAFHPTVKQIVPSHDINKNFKLLKNLRKSLPNLEIEIMANEGCMGGCPHRLEHSLTEFSRYVEGDDISLNTKYCSDLCGLFLYKYPFLFITKASNIYPWEIEEYSKIGINKFKLVGREAHKGAGDSALDSYYNYLICIDDDKNLNDKLFNQLVHHIYYEEIYKIPVKEIRPYLPKIDYFKKHGHLCASECGVECRYCYECAEKMERKFHKKQEKS
ncbi:U32 family peptidase [bacterium]|nr:U32 family peptidase [bacterium]